ncbi:MAG: hypothetical protein R2792_01800 [Saprospiraceae bacterium]
MGLKMLLPVILLWGTGIGFSQNPVFEKKTGRFTISVVPVGYHLDFYSSSKLKVDTIFRYEYGSYLNARVKDIRVFGNTFICT